MVLALVLTNMDKNCMNSMSAHTAPPDQAPQAQDPKKRFLLENAKFQTRDCQTRKREKGACNSGAGDVAGGACGLGHDIGRSIECGLASDVVRGVLSGAV